MIEPKYYADGEDAYDMRKPFKKTLEKRKAEAELKEKEAKEGPAKTVIQ
jgi:hypothetical protein